MNEILDKEYFNDLKEYGKEYSVSNLKRIVRIANEFSLDEFSAQVASQIPWFTLAYLNIN